MTPGHNGHKVSVSKGRLCPPAMETEMVIYLVYPGGGIAAWQGRNIGLGSMWAYLHGHAHRHESVWIVPGLAEG